MTTLRGMNLFLTHRFKLYSGLKLWIIITWWTSDVTARLHLSLSTQHQYTWGKRTNPSVWSEQQDSGILRQKQRDPSKQSNGGGEMWLVSKLLFDCGEHVWMCSLITCMWTHWCARVCVPGARPIKIEVKEGNDAILQCSINSTDIRQVLFDWKKDKKDVFMYDQGKVHTYKQFRGRVSHFPDDLELGNASIRIRATKFTDSGNYTCDFPRLVPVRRSNIVLVVGEFFHKNVQKMMIYGCDWFKCARVKKGRSPPPLKSVAEVTWNILSLPHQAPPPSPPQSPAQFQVFF